MACASQHMIFGSIRRVIVSCIALLLCGWTATAQPQAPGDVEILTLHSKIFGNTRSLRVWLPPQYRDPKQPDRKYPVFYFTDGVAVFHGRELDRVAAKLIRDREIPPTIFVGIDNAGSTLESKNPGSDRANEYLPYPDEFLNPPLPHPQGKLFPSFLEEEVRPLVRIPLPDERRGRTGRLFVRRSDRALHSSGAPGPLPLAAAGKSLSLHRQR